MEKEKCPFLRNEYLHHSHIDGNFYKNPAKKPFVLHDAHGCLCVDEKKFEELTHFEIFKISHAHDCDKLNVKKGIAHVPGYVKCLNALTCPAARFRKASLTNR